MAKKAASASTSKSAAKRKTTPLKGGNRGTKKGTTVKVRMYCQGLGDCFLATFPSASGTQPVRVLIDCGVFQNTPGEAAKLRQVAKDIRRETGGEIDLLIITHEHWTTSRDSLTPMTSSISSTSRTYGSPGPRTSTTRMRRDSRSSSPGKRRE